MSWTERTRPVQVGDRVAYSKAFLQSIACYTGDMPQARGVVTALVPVGQTILAEIAWDLPDLPQRVNIYNIRGVKQAALE